MKQLAAVVCVVLGVVHCGNGGGSSAASSSSSGGAGMDAGVPDAAVVVPDPTGWTDAPAMTHGRQAHTATLLNDGRLLVVGGERVDRTMLVTSEIYDPGAQQWNDAEVLAQPRSNHVAVLLPNGKVLIAGGGKSAPIGQPSGLQVTHSALLFDPQPQTFAATGDMVVARSHFQAVLLSSGKVLVAGGGTDGTQFGATCNGVPNCGPLADGTATAELYDPATGTWTATGEMTAPRYSFSLTLLAADGRALAVAGVNHTLHSLNSVDVYDPMTGAWTPVADLPGQDREHHSAILLPSGAVMVAGGKQANIGMLSRVDIFDPMSNTWRAGPRLPSVRTVPGLVMLTTGHVLTTGGFNQPLQTTVGDALLFDESNPGWMAISDLALSRSGATLTLMPNGDVMVVGGINWDVYVESKTCEVTAQ